MHNKQVIIMQLENNMQEYAKNMQNTKQIDENMQKICKKYSIYVGSMFCKHKFKICTGDFADDSANATIQSRHLWRSPSLPVMVPAK